jgi:hypothetical protein
MVLSGIVRCPILQPDKLWCILLLQASNVSGWAADHGRVELWTIERGRVVCRPEGEGVLVLTARDVVFQNEKCRGGLQVRVSGPRKASRNMTARPV